MLNIMAECSAQRAQFKCFLQLILLLKWPLFLPYRLHLNFDHLRLYSHKISNKTITNSNMCTAWLVISVGFKFSWISWVKIIQLYIPQGAFFEDYNFHEWTNKGNYRKPFPQIYIGDACIVKPVFLSRGIIAFIINALHENRARLVIVRLKYSPSLFEIHVYL